MKKQNMMTLGSSTTGFKAMGASNPYQHPFSSMKSMPKQHKVQKSNHFESATSLK